MKKIVYLFALSLIAFSCFTNDPPPPKEQSAKFDQSKFGTGVFGP